MRTLIALSLLLAACGSSTTSGNDMSATGSADLAMSGGAADLSMVAGADFAGTDGGGALCCNDPRNTGNSVGVGKYCNDSSQCGGSAIFCATLGDPTEHFCTMPCTQGQTNCGSGATCQCQGTSCGCTPDVCVTPPPGC